MAQSTFSSAASESRYLEVSVDNVKGVQISHRLQHLANHVTGVTLRVVTLVQDPVKHLPACGSAQKQSPQQWKSKAVHHHEGLENTLNYSGKAGKKSCGERIKIPSQTADVHIYGKKNTPVRAEVCWTSPQRCASHVSSFPFYNFSTPESHVLKGRKSLRLSVSIKMHQIPSECMPMRREQLTSNHIWLPNEQISNICRASHSGYPP